MDQAQTVSKRFGTDCNEREEQMATLITSVCKYSMIIVMILYTVLAFWSLKYKSVENMRGCYWGMNLLTFSFLTLGFAVIAINERRILMVGYYAAILLYFIVYLLVYRYIYKKANLALLSHMLMFLTIGFILLTRLNPRQSVKQYIIVVGSSVLTLIVPKMFAKLKAARNWAMVMGIVGVLMLGAVLVVGKLTRGANLYINIGFFSFQPSEFVKISFVLLIAVLLRERTDLKRVLLSACIAALHGVILVASRDLGAALIFFVSYLMMLYVATKQKVYLFLWLDCRCDGEHRSLFSVCTCSCACTDLASSICRLLWKGQSDRKLTFRNRNRRLVWTGSLQRAAIQDTRSYHGLYLYRSLRGTRRYHWHLSDFDLHRMPVNVYCSCGRTVSSVL